MYSIDLIFRVLRHKDRDTWEFTKNKKIEGKGKQGEHLVYYLEDTVDPIYIGYCIKTARFVITYKSTEAYVDSRHIKEYIEKCKATPSYAYA